ncbi:MAG: hypothetical protein EXQ77_03330 [Thermoleophilia bacterium]|nr:hypothetical protein [Thermoleophilia bacterium]
MDGVTRWAIAGGVLAAAAASLAVAGPPRTDFAAVSLNILPPGQAGGVAFTKNSTDQAALYDRLTPLQDRVSAADLAKTFKAAPLGLGKEQAVKVERPRAGVTITRDRWGVPHIAGKRDVDVAFGAGWATAQDRQLIMELLRGPGRIAALDAPGVDAFGLALSGKQFIPTVAAEARLAKQFDLLVAEHGAKGKRLLAVIDAYIAGINGYYARESLQIEPWTRTDVVGVAGLIGAVFGGGGGDEVARSAFLSALQKRLGVDLGRQVFDDLRLRDDPEARTAVEGRFPHGKNASEAGNVVVDAGSVKRAGEATAASTPPPRLSNALLVSASRSATGKPLAVMGPQVGYYYPEILLELDLQGGGYAARGAAFPGISFAVLLGRGADFAWSATSAGGDVVDQYVETLCDGATDRYLHLGVCRTMTAFDAGLIRGAPGTPDVRVRWLETVHGPVGGYATVGGVKVAFTSKRSTRGRELLAAPFFFDLSTGAVRSQKQFAQGAARVELTFNWHYVDDRDIAVFTSGRLPVRPASVDPGLPTKGTGDFEWKGFLPAAAHAQQVNPASGLIVNWNNKHAAGMVAADNEWAYGPVQRVDLLWSALERTRKHTVASLVGAMNLAATQDLRVVRVWPAVRAILDRGVAPTEQSSAAAALVDTWLAGGGSRLDADLDGKIDAAGAAVLDAAWRGLGDAVLGPRLGPLVDDLDRLAARDDPPAHGGSSYGYGWFSYLDKDLRALAGRSVKGRFATQFCGLGDVAVCASALWQALDTASATLEAAQGADPAKWRASATAERIRFSPGILPDTIRWANRPTFQQVVSFDGRRS